MTALTFIAGGRQRMLGASPQPTQSPSRAVNSWAAWSPGVGERAWPGRR